MQPVQLGEEVPGRVGGLVTVTLRSVQNPDAASTVGWEVPGRVGDLVPMPNTVRTVACPGTVSNNECRRAR